MILGGKVTKFFVMVGKAYVALAVVQFIIGVCFCLWMVLHRATSTAISRK